MKMRHSQKLVIANSRRIEAWTAGTAKALTVTSDQQKVVYPTPPPHLGTQSSGNEKKKKLIQEMERIWSQHYYYALYKLSGIHADNDEPPAPPPTKWHSQEELPPLHAMDFDVLKATPAASARNRNRLTSSWQLQQGDQRVKDPNGVVPTLQATTSQATTSQTPSP